MAIPMAFGMEIVLFGLAAFGGSWAGTRLFLRLLRAAGVGQPIRDYGPKIHEHKQGTPTMGGVILLIVYFTVLLAYQRVLPLDAWGVVLLGALLGFGLIGFLDDALKLWQRHAQGLPARWKLLGQLLVAGGVIGLLRGFGLESELPPLRLPWGGSWEWEGAALYGLIVLTFVATVNAWNLTDGLDGLAAGVTMLVLAAYTVLFAFGFPAVGVEGAGGGVFPSLGALTVLLGAALLGFLWWNVYPARIFLGDTGSMALGGFVAALSVLTGTEFFLLLFGIVPALEALSVIVQVASFRLFGRRIFKVSPLHHHFERAEGVDYPYLVPSVELPEWAITLLFWALSAGGVIGGLWLWFSRA